MRSPRRRVGEHFDRTATPAERAAVEGGFRGVLRHIWATNPSFFAMAGAIVLAVVLLAVLIASLI